MRAFLVILALILVPFAAADGPSASLTTLTQDSSCSSSSSYDYGSGSYPDPTPVPVSTTPVSTTPVPSDPVIVDNSTGNATDGNSTNSTPPTYYGGYGYYDSYSTHGCQSEADTLSAQAGDDAGTLAYARAYQNNSSQQSSEYHNGYSWLQNSDGTGYSNNYYSSGEQGSQSDARGVEAGAVGVVAGEASGCSSSYQQHEAQHDGSDTYAWPDGSTQTSSYDDYSVASSDANGCGDQVYATSGGHGASAGDVSSCDRSDAYDATYSTDQGYWNGESSGSSQHACRSGAAADADGTAVFAGQEDTCSQHASGQTYGGESHGSSTRDCFDGYVVEGPAGARLSVGNETIQHSWCDYNAGGNNTTACSHDEFYQEGVSWTWAQSPVSPLSQLWIGVPQPVMP